MKQCQAHYVKKSAFLEKNRKNSIILGQETLSPAPSHKKVGKNGRKKSPSGS
jgi:hypothetical protein